MQSLSDIRAILDSRGLRPKHRFGQNFLTDAGKLARILAAAELQPGDRVLEVGPGTGVLTEQLLEQGVTVIAVEIDRDLAAILRERLGKWGERFTLIEGDVLDGKHRLSSNVIAALAGGPFKLIANLPYNVASPLLANLAVDYPAMSLAIVMIQREVADRLTAGPGGKEYGPLGVIVQAMCQVERITTLSPACFWPQPKVDSAVLRLVRRPEPLTADPHALSGLLQKVFGQRRKQLGSILGRDTPLPAGIDPQSRPEQLSIEQLIALTRRGG